MNTILHLSKHKMNKKLFEEYIKYLLDTFFNFNNKYNIIINNYYLTYKCFYPLPTKLVNDGYILNNKITADGNIYSFDGTPTLNRILFANRLLPLYGKDPIPFTFPIINKNDEIVLLNSNVYYYELELLESTREGWVNESISIGYSTINMPINSNPGWYPESFGYHLDDGTFQYNQILFKKIAPICSKGDTVGIGIIYLQKNTYEPFITFNGSLIKLDLITINIKNNLVPIIGYDHSHKIKLNFGNEKFKFDISSYLHNNIVLSDENNFIKMEHKIDKICTEHTISRKLINLPMNTNISNVLNIPMFSFTEQNDTNNLNNILLTIFNQNNF